MVRAGIKEEMAYLGIACGGGDVAFDMARMVGPLGRVVGTDIDETELELASRCTGRARRCKAKQGRRGKTALTCGFLPSQ